MARPVSLKTRLGNFIRRKERTDYFWKLRHRAATSRFILANCWYWHQYRKLMLRHNAGIPLSTVIEGRPSFPHGLSGIFISAGAKLGTGCTIFQQVTIGSNTLPDSRGKGAPVLGNNVYIGAGAKIIGGVHIGDNVRIGANCVVTRDIPANCTVVLERPRIIVHDHIVDNTFVGIND